MKLVIFFILLYFIFDFHIISINFRADLTQARDENYKFHDKENSEIWNNDVKTFNHRNNQTSIDEKNNSNNTNNISSYNYIRLFTISSCLNSCGNIFSDCSCNTRCEKMKNCCSDYHICKNVFYNSSKINNCKLSGLNNEKCVQCNEGFFYFNNECLEECPENSQTIYQTKINVKHVKRKIQVVLNALEVF